LGVRALNATGRVTRPQLNTVPKSVARRIARLTCPLPLPTLAGFGRRRSDDERGTQLDEANVPAERPAPQEDARLPQPHGDQGRPQGPQTEAGEGAQTADGVTGRFPRQERLTSGADFQALFQGGRRVDRPLMVVLWRQATSDQGRRAGFTVSRQVRGAVARNRVKRRLREAYRRARSEAPARVSLVIVGRPAVSAAPMATVVDEMRRALGSIRGERPTG
jgi:ribonuclease P protein component